MATSALILLTLLNNSTMSNMFDITAQEKNKLKQIKKQQCENRCFKMREYRESMYKNTQKTYNLNSRHYNYLNCDIVKEHKR